MIIRIFHPEAIAILFFLFNFLILPPLANGDSLAMASVDIRMPYSIMTRQLQALGSVLLFGVRMDPNVLLESGGP